VNALAFFEQKQSGLRQQFVINVGSNVGQFLLNFLLNIWFIPYLIGHLGIAAYGLVPLTTTLTAYFGLLTLSLNSALGRFLTIDLKRGLFSSANRTFNTAFFTNLFLSSLVVPLTLGLVWATPRLFNVPQGQENGTRWLFGLAMLAFIVTTIGSNFAVSSWACNRFDLRNGLTIASRVVQVGLVVLSFSFFGAQLWHVGLGLLGAAVVSLAGSVVLWRYLTPQLHVRSRAFDRSRLRQLTGMSGWMLINQIGSLLFLQIDLIVVNRFFGPEMGGQYGAVLQLSVYLRTMANMLVGVLTPAILAKYAENDWTGMNRISRQAVKFLGMAMAIPVGLLCGFSRPLLSTWLGPSFRDSAPLLILLSAHLCINLAVRPLFSIQQAFNKVRWPGVVTFIMGVANLVLAIALAKWGGWGALGVAVAGGITLTLKNTLFTSIYSAVIQKSPWWNFLSSIIPGLVSTMAVSSMAYAITQVLTIDSWLGLAVASLVVSGLYSGVAYVAGLNKEEQALLRSLIPRVA
jgi:O-antigen/teichoic acid export membrane protein